MGFFSKIFGMNKQIDKVSSPKATQNRSNPSNIDSAIASNELFLKAALKRNRGIKQE